jgi:AraC family transcriptional regulator
MILLRCDMDARLKFADRVGVAEGVIAGLSVGEERLAPVRFVSRSLKAEDLIAAEAGKLLEDIRLALVCDLSTATQAAGDLVTLLAGSRPAVSPVEPARGGLAPWQKHKIQSYIEGQLERPILIAELAKLVSLSCSYFCRAFKESFGDTPHVYITRARMKRARTLMLTTSQALSEIALACGLADQSHLCRCFRQATGSTPGAWRRRHAL